MTTSFFGMRGTGDWVANARPENWRETILYLFPNGTAPLTAMLSKMRSEETDDPVFHWWTETLSTRSATITGIYTDAGLGSAYASGGVAGDILYIKMSAAAAAEFRVDRQVLLRDASDPRVDVNGLVTGKLINGSSSYVAVKLLEADDNATASPAHDLSDADTIVMLGSATAEGSPLPDSIAYDPDEFSNQTQIFTDSMELTRTAMKTHLRTGNYYKDLKTNCLRYHSIGIEMATIWGILSTGVGTNGKPKRTTRGIIPTIKQYAPDNVSDYTLASAYSGQAWLQGGKKWLNNMLEQLFRYGRNEKMAFVGSGALLAINELAETFGQIRLEVGAGAYGIQVMKWITPFGTIMMKTHPLFSYEATNRNSMLIIEPEELIYRYITDTVFKADNSDMDGGQTTIDGKKEGFLTECGIEVHHPSVHGYLTGLGQLNVV